MGLASFPLLFYCSIIELTTRAKGAVQSSHSNSPKTANNFKSVGFIGAEITLTPQGIPINKFRGVLCLLHVPMDPPDSFASEFASYTFAAILKMVAFTKAVGLLLSSILEKCAHETITKRDDQRTKGTRGTTTKHRVNTSSVFIYPFKKPQTSRCAA